MELVISVKEVRSSAAITSYPRHQPWPAVVLRQLLIKKEKAQRMRFNRLSPAPTAPSRFVDNLIFSSDAFKPLSEQELKALIKFKG